MNHFLLYAFFLLLPFCFQAQNLINGDLEGVMEGPSSLPTDWDAVPYTDPNCQAYSEAYATPDLTGVYGPFVHTGIGGQPYSGETFVSGLFVESFIEDVFWQEGIQQSVSGFSPNGKYLISFYQTVVKQNNGSNYEFAIDTSGSWTVYLDDLLVGVTEPSVSLLPFDEIALNWDLRELSFTATQETHTLKFLPSDDDPVSNTNDENGGLRMGIDYIQIGMLSSAKEFDSDQLIRVYPNPSADLFNVELDQTYSSVRVEVLNMQGQIVLVKQYQNIDNLKFTLDYPNGMYLLRMDLDGRHIVMKRIWKN